MTHSAVFVHNYLRAMSLNQPIAAVATNTTTFTTATSAILKFQFRPNLILTSWRISSSGTRFFLICRPPPLLRPTFLLASSSSSSRVSSNTHVLKNRRNDYTKLQHFYQQRFPYSNYGRYAYDEYASDEESDREVNTSSSQQQQQLKGELAWRQGSGLVGKKDFVQ